MKIRNGKILGKQVMVEGLMTLGKLETGLRTLDFQCCEDVQAEAFAGNFKVQGTRDGNIYMMEKPKRKRNTPLFREDNSSLSQGQNKRWYFYFSLDDNQLEQLPEKLIRQATAIAMKCILEYELDVKSILI